MPRQLRYQFYRIGIFTDRIPGRIGLEEFCVRRIGRHFDEDSQLLKGKIRFVRPSVDLRPASGREFDLQSSSHGRRERTKSVLNRQAVIFHRRGQPI
jgi:hypothetical protein